VPGNVQRASWDYKSATVNVRAIASDVENLGARNH
jgi:hypothetical protein